MGKNKKNIQKGGALSNSKVKSYSENYNNENKPNNNHNQY